MGLLSRVSIRLLIMGCTRSVAVVIVGLNVHLSGKVKVSLLVDGLVNFGNNFELLKTYGGLVIPHNPSWGEIETLMGTIKNEMWRSMSDPNFDYEAERKALSALIKPVFDRSLKMPG